MSRKQNPTLDEILGILSFTQNELRQFYQECLNYRTKHNLSIDSDMTYDQWESFKTHGVSLPVLSTETAQKIRDGDDDTRYGFECVLMHSLQDSPTHRTAKKRTRDEAMGESSAENSGGSSNTAKLRISRVSRTKTSAAARPLLESRPRQTRVAGFDRDEAYLAVLDRALPKGLSVRKKIDAQKMFLELADGLSGQIDETILEVLDVLVGFCKALFWDDL